MVYFVFLWYMCKSGIRHLLIRHLKNCFLTDDFFPANTLLLELGYKKTQTFQQSIMKLLCTFIVLATLGVLSPAFAQKALPVLEVKTLDGKTINIQDITKDGKIVVLSFWATWCKPCQLELDALADLYETWQKEYNVSIVAVTIDTQRALAKVGPMVESKGWSYTILSDANQQLKNALNFQTIPQTFLLDASGNVVYEHSGYVPGDEYELEKKIMEVGKR